MKHTVYIAKDRAEFFATIPEATPSAKVNRCLELAECTVNRIAMDLRSTLYASDWSALRNFRTDKSIPAWREARDELSVTLAMLDRLHIKVLDWMLDRWEMEGVAPWE